MPPSVQVRGRSMQGRDGGSIATGCVGWFAVDEQKSPRHYCGQREGGAESMAGENLSFGITCEGAESHICRVFCSVLVLFTEAGPPVL